MQRRDRERSISSRTFKDNERIKASYDCAFSAKLVSQILYETRISTPSPKCIPPATLRTSNCNRASN